MAIVGESGCGKSTFAKVLIGLETATEGKVGARRPGHRRRAGAEARARRSCATCRWCSRTRSTRSTRATRSAARSPRVIRKFGVEQRAGRRCASGCCSCSTSSSCRATSTSAGRASSRAARSSASASPAPSPATRGGGGRRAGLGARRLGAGGGHQAADGDPAREPHHAAVHQPRPVAGALSRRPGGGDVSRHDRRAGHHRRGLRAALPPLYRGAAVGGADRRHLGREEAHRAGGQHPVGDQPAAGLPVPDPLPAQDRRDLRDQAPPIRVFGTGHRIACHIAPEELARSIR